MKKLTDFESFDDFGFTPISLNKGKIKYVKCDSDFENLVDSSDSDIVFSNGDLTSGKFFSLENILSGGTLNIPTEDVDEYKQAELALDYNLITSLAYLGSAYSTVLIGINKIQEDYPNGFIIVTGVASTGTLMFNNSDTTTYGADPFSVFDYTDYELIQTLSGAYDQTFDIIEPTTITGGTYSLLFLDGNPTTGGLYGHIIQPKTSTLDKFYSTLTQYELDLLIPPFDRTNYYPRDSVATNNILFEGAEYDTFVDEETSWASLADNEDVNFIWRKLYPDGQKNLDSDDGIMKKLISVMAANFDNIKKYQDQLKYQQTIGYETNNHISKDLVEKLSNQWNWSLGHNLIQDDYSSYMYSTYENYVTGQTQQKLSAKDVNFEIWRRVLSNLIHLYKKKGTKEAIKYISNIYGLPEALLWIDEFVKIANDNGGDELAISSANIVVPINGELKYVDSIGGVQTLDYKVIGNTKYLNINVSPASAIEFDFYDWGWANHPDSDISSLTEISQIEFNRRVLNESIQTGAKYDVNYPFLETQADTYYSYSVNKFNFNRLYPFLEFLDDNWNILITNLIPASSKLISSGTLYRNLMWNREKYKWDESELDPKALPFNEDVELDNFIPIVELNRPNEATIQTEEISSTLTTPNFGTITQQEISGTKQPFMSTTIQPPVESAEISTSMFGTIDINDPIGDYCDASTGSATIEQTPTGVTYTLDSPLIVPISGQYGSDAFTSYDANSLVVTNQNTFNVVFSASNLSNGGYTKLEFELFEKQHDDVVTIDEDNEFSIMTVLNESDTYGTYKTSSVYGIDTFDYIQIDSEYLPFINQIVQVTYIDSGTSQIRTSPPIGLFSLPTGVDNNLIDWFDFIASDAINRLIVLEMYLGLTMSEIISVLVPISELVDGGAPFEYASIISRAIAELGINEVDAQLFTWFMTQEPGIVYGSLLLLEFVKGDTAWNLSSPPIPMINMVVSTQTKATFNRVINFFNWTQPDQQVDRINSWVASTMDASTTYIFTGETGDFISSQNDVSFSAIGQSMKMEVGHVEPYIWGGDPVPFQMLVTGSNNNDGLYTITGVNVEMMATTFSADSSTIVDESASVMSRLYYWTSGHTIYNTGITFTSLFSVNDHIIISGSSSNDGDYEITGVSTNSILVVEPVTEEIDTNSITATSLTRHLTHQGDFNFTYLDPDNRESGNTYSMTGTVSYGGTNQLNANVLNDKSEYFHRYRTLTHTPISWGQIHGLFSVPQSLGGGSLLDSGYELEYFNDVKYYGNYFMYMLTPKVPVASILGLNPDGEAVDASITASWNGVGDSDRLELQYLTASNATSPYSTYEDITEADWYSSTTINVSTMNNIGDDYIYTIQTTLEPDTYYWWRVKNFRNKINMFGHNLERFTSTQPEVFQTGSFAGGGDNSGEIPEEPIIPDPDIPIPKEMDKFSL